jgi:hypothetical protein
VYFKKLRLCCGLDVVFVCPYKGSCPGTSVPIVVVWRWWNLLREKTPRKMNTGGAILGKN